MLPPSLQSQRTRSVSAMGRTMSIKDFLPIQRVCEYDEYAPDISNSLHSLEKAESPETAPNVADDDVGFSLDDSDHGTPPSFEGQRRVVEIQSMPMLDGNRGQPMQRRGSLKSVQSVEDSASGFFLGSISSHDNITHVSDAEMTESGHSLRESQNSNLAGTPSPTFAPSPPAPPSAIPKERPMPPRAIPRERPMPPKAIPRERPMPPRAIPVERPMPPKAEPFIPQIDRSPAKIAPFAQAQGKKSNEQEPANAPPERPKLDKEVNDILGGSGRGMMSRHTALNLRKLAEKASKEDGKPERAKKEDKEKPARKKDASPEKPKAKTRAPGKDELAPAKIRKSPGDFSDSDSDGDDENALERRVLERRESRRMDKSEQGRSSRSNSYERRFEETNLQSTKSAGSRVRDVDFNSGDVENSPSVHKQTRPKHGRTHSMSASTSSRHRHRRMHSMPTHSSRSSHRNLRGSTSSDSDDSGRLDRSHRHRRRKTKKKLRKSYGSDDSDSVSVCSELDASSRSTVASMTSKVCSLGSGIRSGLRGLSRGLSLSAMPGPVGRGSKGDFSDTKEEESYYSSDESSEDDESEITHQPWDETLWTEGEYYLAMSMLVYIFAMLRETSMLGHTDIPFEEVDVNSYQSIDTSDVGLFNLSSKMHMLDKTKSAGYVVRVVMDELEKKGGFSTIDEADNNVMEQFKKWVVDSRRKDIDSAMHRTIKELRRKVARRRWKRAIMMVQISVRLCNFKRFGNRNRSTSNVPAAARRKSFSGSFSEMFTGANKGNADNCSDVQSPSEKPSRRQTTSEKPSSLGGFPLSLSWLRDSRAQRMNVLGLEKLKNSITGENKIEDIISDTLDEPRFFREGSLLSNLIESGIEIAWFGDRHPNDVVYSLCINRQLKRVSVVFRGSVTRHNWKMNMKIGMVEHENPVKEDYPDREDMVGIHEGFALYMTRKRKDDSMTKVEEILSFVDRIGRELAPDGDYKISITGHSLGGALATILTFYAATSHLCNRVKEIRSFVFAAPRVGCCRFLSAFQHLERSGRIRMARFANMGDIVPAIPFSNLTFIGGSHRAYRHVGLQVRLSGVGRISQFWMRRNLDIYHPCGKNVQGRLGFLSVIRNGFWNSLFLNLNSIKGYKHNHTLSEYQKRIHFTYTYRETWLSGFYQSRKKSRLKTLDEYYFIRGLSHKGSRELARIQLEERAKQKATQFVTILVLVAVFEVAILLVILKSLDLVPCDKYPALLYPLSFLTGCKRIENDDVRSSCPMPLAPPTTGGFHFAKTNPAFLSTPEEGLPTSLASESSVPMPALAREDEGPSPVHDVESKPEVEDFDDPAPTLQEVVHSQETSSEDIFTVEMLLPDEAIPEHTQSNDAAGIVTNPELPVASGMSDTSEADDVGVPTQDETAHATKQESWHVRFGRTFWKRRKITDQCLWGSSCRSSFKSRWPFGVKLPDHEELPHAYVVDQTLIPKQKATFYNRDSIEVNTSFIHLETSRMLLELENSLN